MFLTKEAFRSLLVKRWKELLKEQLSLTSLYSRIDSNCIHINSAQQRNFTRWNMFENPHEVRKFRVESFEQEIENVKKWIEQRVDWIDIEIRNM